MLSYMEAAGDFGDAVGPPPTPGTREGTLLIPFKLPYCLLRAHSEFLHEAQRDPANHGENVGRGMF